MKKRFKSFEEMCDYYGIRNLATFMKPSNISTNEHKGDKKNEHKFDNNIRLQITIDCRIL